VSTFHILEHSDVYYLMTLFLSGKEQTSNFRVVLTRSLFKFFKWNCSNLIFISNTTFISTTPYPRISRQASNTSTCSLQSEFGLWRFLVNSFNEMHPFLGKFPELQKVTQLGDV